MPCFLGDNLFFFFLNGTVGRIRVEFRQDLLGGVGGAKVHRRMDARE